MPAMKMTKSIGKSLKRGHRRAVSSAKESLVKGQPLYDDEKVPYQLTPAVTGVDLIGWAAANREFIDQLLLEHRALLFRDFEHIDTDNFQKFVIATSNGQLLEYKDRTTPRENRGQRVYTSTIHPADQTIRPHNEGTYWTQWAMKIYLCCLLPAAEGGETPIADVRNVYRRIDPAISQRFEEKSWMLSRNFNDGFGLPWQEVFQTNSKDKVEAYCRSNDIHFEWKDKDRLRTRQVRPPVRKHPLTGELVWFNHAAFFHYTSLEQDMLDALLSELGQDELPYNTFYGDGSPIEDEVAEHLRQAYKAETVMFPWHKGDILLLDNMTMTHARQPYVGDREVIVAMTDAVSGATL